MTHPSLLEQWDVAVPAHPAPEKTYIGRRVSGGAAFAPDSTVVTVVEGGEERPLEQQASQPSVRFEWGYRGVGPSALAAALLADHLGYLPPTMLYFRYRDEVISRLRHDGWAIASSDVAAWLSTHLTRGRP